MITWVSNYRCLIWTFCNQTPVIGYPLYFHVTCAHFNGFLSNVFYSFQNLGKALQTLSLKRSSQKTFLTPKFGIPVDTINSIQGVLFRLVISNRPRALRSSDFEITHTITPWIILHSVQFLLRINWCYNHDIKKLPNHWWTCWYYFPGTIGYHSNATTR